MNDQFFFFQRFGINLQFSFTKPISFRITAVIQVVNLHVGSFTKRDCWTKVSFLSMYLVILLLSYFAKSERFGNGFKLG